MSIATNSLNINGNGLVAYDNTTGLLGVTATPSPSITWIDEPISFSALAANGYMITASSVVATLPASPSLGDTISFIVNVTGVASLTIQASAGQQIQIANSQSSVGGTATNNFIGDTITLVYSDFTGNWFSLNQNASWTLT